MTDEAVIIKKILAGDINAFAVLVERYKDLAITLAYNIVQNSGDAEDIVQDAFIKAWSGLATFKGDAKFSTWFYRIVLNTALNKRKLKKVDTVSTEDRLPEELVNPISLELNIYNTNEQRRYIQLALKSLNEGERVCITLYYLHELGVQEIEDLTGYSTSNIKVLLHRGRKQLYQELRSLLKKELKDLI